MNLKKLIYCLFRDTQLNSIIAYNLIMASKEAENSFFDEVFYWTQKHSGNGIEYVGKTDTEVRLRVDGGTVTITVPPTYPHSSEGMMLDAEKSVGHLNSINEWIVGKRKRKAKSLMKQIRDHRADHADKVDIDEMGDGIATFMKLDTLTVELNALERRLMGLIATSKNVLRVDDGVERKAAQLFTPEACGRRVVSEFIKVAREYHRSNRVTCELVDDNIFHWRVSFGGFDNRELVGSLARVKELYGYDRITVDLFFHGTMHPTYPVVVQCIRPAMEESLMHRISSMNMVKMEYWTPSRTAHFVIKKLWNTLDKHCVVKSETHLNDITKYPAGAYFDLEAHLMKLAAVVDDDVEASFPTLDDEKYHRQMKAPEAAKPAKPSRYGSYGSSSAGWAKGTGYGHGSQTQFDKSEYLRIQEEKQRRRMTVLGDIYESIKDVSDADRLSAMTTIKGSYLVPFLRSTMKDNTMMDVSTSVALFEMVNNLLTVLFCEEGIFLFDDQRDSTYKIIKDFHRRLSKFGGDGVIDLASHLGVLLEIAKPMMEAHLEMKRLTKAEEAAAEEKAEKEKLTARQVLEKEYADYMGELQFDEYKGIQNGHYYAKQLPGLTVPDGQRPYIMQQWDALDQGMPLHFESSIFIRVDENCPNVMKVLITGAHGTPYESGVHVFDVFLGGNFPTNCPSMWFINHGGKRFNPNLYDSGKVCLSLLGTWSGGEGESWQKGVSTLNQLFISAQSLIMIEDPYFNEPGHESYRGTTQGDSSNLSYNKNIRRYMMTSAMLGQLQKPTPAFRDVILAHFWFKRDHIKETLNKWTGDDSSLKDLCASIFAELDKLSKPPPHDD